MIEDIIQGVRDMLADPDNQAIALQKDDAQLLCDAAARAEEYSKYGMSKRTFQAALVNHLRTHPNDFGQGFHTGIMEAARTLREAAEDHRNQSRESRKVLEAQAHELAAALLGSWANGLEINANRAMPETSLTPLNQVGGSDALAL